MTRRWFHRLAPLAVLLAAGLALRAADAPAPPQPDLSDFRTVETAVVTRISRAAPEPGQPLRIGGRGSIRHRRGCLPQAGVASAITQRHPGKLFLDPTPIR